MISILTQNNIPPELIVFIISLAPSPLAGYIAAVVLQIPPSLAFVIVNIGNILPIPFFMIFGNKLCHITFFNRLVMRIEKNAEKNKHKIEKYGLWGLFIFSSSTIPFLRIGPLPAALIATTLSLPFKRSLIAISCGVSIYGLIVIRVMF